MNLNDQARSSENKSSDTRAQSVNLGLDGPLDRRWQGRVNLSWQESDDRTAADADSSSRRLGLGAGRPITLSGFEGNLWLDLSAIDSRSGGTTKNLAPALNANLAKGPHRISVNLGADYQDQQLANSDVDTVTSRLEYGFQRGRSDFGLGYTGYQRNPENAQSTNAYQLSAFWRYRFDYQSWDTAKPPGVTRRQGKVAHITDLAPGAPIGQTLARIPTKGYSEPAPGLLVFQQSLMEDIDAGQRLAVQGEAGSVSRSALVFDLDDVTDYQAVASLYQSIKNRLLKHYGAPAHADELGDFDQAMFVGLETGAFQRLLQWRLPEGVLRFGIPRRLDGIYRMELQFTQGQALVGDAAWSMEEVR